MGLKLVINNRPEDYFYSTLSTMGVQVLIYQPGDYPDKVSGSLVDLIAPIETATFVEVTSSIVKSEDSIKAYPLEKVSNCCVVIKLG